LQGKEVSAAREEVIERMMVRIAEVMKEELTWDQLEPIYTGIYREALTQEEMDGMLEFYQTPAGGGRHQQDATRHTEIDGCDPAAYGTLDEEDTGDSEGNPRGAPRGNWVVLNM